MIRHRLWIDGKTQEGGKGGGAKAQAEIHSPFNGEVVALADQADAAQMEQAIAAAAAAQALTRRLSRFARAALLQKMAEGIESRKPEIVRSMQLEAGKPTAAAEGEVARALVTFRIAAEETHRLGGEVIPLDVDAGGRPYAPAVSFWVPRGPVLGITPFNFPINLVAHKVAPALAAGCPILIKSAPQAPGGAALLAEIFAAAARAVSDSRETIPLAYLQVLAATNDITAAAVTDPRLPTLSFTGSGKVGWELQKAAVGKRVLLELGGNAALIVHEDADLARAATRCAAGGFSYAGQSCISVQRVFVHERVASRFLERLVAETAKLKTGDPLASDVVVGPVIDRAAGDRIMSWIEGAKAAGAKLLCGGTRDRNVIASTILTGVPPELPISCEEVFGPVVLVETYSSFEKAVEAVNRSKFGLHAGVFTDSARLQRYAAQELEVGGVVFNEVPTYRADPMPYGGVKQSGLGREGLRYAIEEYSERRTLIHWTG